jgi:hypothetical protein
MNKTKATASRTTSDGQKVIVRGEIKPQGVTYTTSINGKKSEFGFLDGKNTMPIDFYAGMSDETHRVFSNVFVQVTAELGFIPENEKEDAVRLLMKPAGAIAIPVEYVEQWLALEAGKVPSPSKKTKRKNNEKN